MTQDQAVLFALATAKRQREEKTPATLDQFEAALDAYVQCSNIAKKEKTVLDLRTRTIAKRVYMSALGRKARRTLRQSVHAAAARAISLFHKAS